MPSIAMNDFDRVRTMWNHYWAGDVPGRPLVVASAWHGERIPGKKVDLWERAYRLAVTGDFKTALEQIDLILQATEYIGETIPCFSSDHGPDQFAAFCGADLHYTEESGNTNWAKPVIDDWQASLPLRFDENSRTWRSIIEYSHALAAHSKGRYAVAVADLHSNIDTLAALRGPEKLCMDFYECPDQVEQAMKQVRTFYKPVYEKLHEAGNMRQTGSMGWAPFWCEGRFATIQADFICMVSPQISRQYIIPALEEEAQFLDHCVYHLDGPGTLPHLDDILSIKKIDVIQWVPGAGQPPQHEWMDVLKKCQKAGKGLQLFDITSLDVVKKIHRELDPKGLVYCLGGTTREQSLEIIDWLEKNT